MRITLGGQYWRLRLVNRLGSKKVPLDGDCLHDDQVIRVERGLSERDQFETFIHEALHAAFPWLREWIIDRTAKELTAMLFDRLGYRKRG